MRDKLVCEKAKDIHVLVGRAVDSLFFLISRVIDMVLFIWQYLLVVVLFDGLFFLFVSKEGLQRFLRTLLWPHLP